MWSNVFSNLQSDLSDFAKELSSGVPKAKEDETVPTTNDSATQNTSEEEHQSLRAAAVGDTSQASIADAGKEGNVETRNPEEKSSTFLLDWASSSEDDDDDDDVASEWEQVTKTALSSGLGSGGVSVGTTQKAVSGKANSNAACEEIAQSRTDTNTGQLKASTATSTVSSGKATTEAGGPSQEDTVRLLQDQVKQLQLAREKDAKDLAVARAEAESLRARLQAQGLKLQEVKAELADLQAVAAKQTTPGSSLE
eukprot:INCI11764.1.p1 GENE.INCI11764.1~~INCI11764.1.p1  ORF type:complete len:253 (+),score=71.09 INCI11764.1:189-947(+)